MVIDKIKLLKKSSFFNNMSNQELKKLEKHVVIRRLDKRIDVFSEEEMGDAFYIIISGIIKIYKSSSSGQIKTLAFLQEGDFFGEMALLDKNIRSATARVIEPSEIVVINRLDFVNILRENPELGMKIMSTLSHRIREANRQIEALTFQNIIGRIAMVLLDFAEKYGRKTKEGILIDFDLTHQELADLVGTAREIITKTLNKLKILKCIKNDRHRIIITYEKGLKELIY